VMTGARTCSRRSCSVGLVTMSPLALSVTARVEHTMIMDHEMDVGEGRVHQTRSPQRPGHISGGELSGEVGRAGIDDDVPGPVEQGGDGRVVPAEDAQVAGPQRSPPRDGCSSRVP